MAAQLHQGGIMQIQEHRILWMTAGYCTMYMCDQSWQKTYTFHMILYISQFLGKHWFIEQFWSHTCIMVKFSCTRAGFWSQYECCFTSTRIPIIKIRWSHICLIFIYDGNPHTWKDGLHIETAVLETGRHFRSNQKLHLTTWNVAFEGCVAMMLCDHWRGEYPLLNSLAPGRFEWNWDK